MVTGIQWYDDGALDWISASFDVTPSWVRKSNQSTFEDHGVWENSFTYQYISIDICDHPTTLGAVEEKMESYMHLH